MQTREGEKKVVNFGYNEDKKEFKSSVSVSDPDPDLDPVGSGIICRIQNTVLD